MNSKFIIVYKAGWGEAQAKKSVESNPLNIGGVAFKNGVGTHAPALMTIDLKGSASRFSANK